MNRSVSVDVSHVRVLVVGVLLVLPNLRSALIILGERNHILIAENVNTWEARRGLDGKSVLAYRVEGHRKGG